jgi:peptide chain release factor 1
MKELLHSFRRKDFRIDTFRCSGNGGQHVNKTDSGVRFTHIETGLTAESREFKSQHQNKKAAFNKLGLKIKEYYTDFYSKNRVKSTETIRTYHEVDNRVTDHLTGLQMPYKIAMDKGIDKMIETRHIMMNETKF